MAASIQYARVIKSLRSFATFPSNNVFLLRHQVVRDSLLLQCFCGSRVTVTYRYLSFGTSSNQMSAPSNQEKRNTDKASKAITESKSNTYSELSLGGKVKQAGKDAAYTGIVVLGIGLTGVMFYAIFRELFSKTSPNNVYTKAYDICREHPRVVELLGKPIKGYGELSGRGRRRHVSHLAYIKDGVNYMRMKFYLEGSKKKATVHLEVFENARGRYDYRYLFVELNDFPQETIIIEDNRLAANVIEV